jgi:hypothetical protein
MTTIAVAAALGSGDDVTAAGEPGFDGEAVGGAAVGADTGAPAGARLASPADAHAVTRSATAARDEVRRRFSTMVYLRIRPNHDSRMTWVCAAERFTCGR